MQPIRHQRKVLDSGLHSRLLRRGSYADDDYNAVFSGEAKNDFP